MSYASIRNSLPGDFLDEGTIFLVRALDFDDVCDKVPALVFGRGGRPERFGRFPVAGGGAVL